MRPPMTTGGGRGAVDGFEAGPMTAAPWGWLPRHRGALASHRAVTGPFRAPGFELAHRRRRRATTDHRGGRTRGQHET